MTWMLAWLTPAIGLWACTFAVATVDKSDGKDSSAVAVKALTAVPTRVAWCQDAGDGSDVGAGGSQLRLMGFDTEDGRGERVILTKLSNYAKPLLTPRGDRVVFSNRQERKIYVVDWDGSGLRPVMDGFALAVWEDPQNSNVWVYAGTQSADSVSMCRVRRHLLAQPAVNELVWDKTLVDIDNFQLSADGRRAGEPVSNSLSPSNGSERRGLIAVLNSNARLPHEKISNGSSLNIRLSPSIFSTSESREKFIGLLKGFIMNGNMHMQLNVIDGDTLRDVQQRPQMYTDMVVRVSGYCAYFTDLGRPLQDDIIRRTQFDNY